MKILSLFEKKTELIKTAHSMHAGPMVFFRPNVKSLPSKLKLGTLLTLEQSLAESVLHILLIGHKVFKQNKPSQVTIVDTKGIWL